MNNLKKLYRDFFGLREAQSMFHVSDEDVDNINQMVDAAKELKTTLGEEQELDEAELLNHMEDYKGGVEYVIADPAQAQSTSDDIRQWAEKKGFKVIKQTISPSGKVGYFYFRLGENPYKESKKIQGYISQLPVVKHFRFNVKTEKPTTNQPQ